MTAVNGLVHFNAVIKTKLPIPNTKLKIDSYFKHVPAKLAGEHGLTEISNRGKIGKYGLPGSKLLCFTITQPYPTFW